MIRLGFRFTMGSGREALYRVLVVAGAVALAVAFLLAALAGANGLNAQANRAAWLNTYVQSPSGSSSAAPTLWWLSSVDQFGSHTIDRVDLAASSVHAPVPPGLPRLPGPGQYYASPAMASLLATTPQSQLGNRYPGREVGLIGSVGLASPDSLVIVVGHAASQLAKVPGAVRVSSILRTPSSCYDCVDVAGSGSVEKFILAGGAIALLLPLLILIATATRLSAARRQERFAAMRLVGATPQQISVIAAVEAVEASLMGVALGFLLFFALRPLLYHVAFTGSRFAPGDLSLSLPDVLLVLLGVPLAAVISARLALRRVYDSPLSVARHGDVAAPRAVRVVPLLAGIAMLAYFDVVGKPGAIGSQILELLVGFFLLVVGLVLAGPWIASLGARLLTSRSARLEGLIAGRRILDDSRASFRFVAGLVVALFISSALFGTLSSADAVSATTSSNASLRTLAMTFCGLSRTGCPPAALLASIPAGELNELTSSPGVTGVTLVHQGPTLQQPGLTFGLVDCSQLPLTPAIGRCVAGASTAKVGYFFSKILGHTSHAAETDWPASTMSVSAVSALPISAIVVATTGTPGTIERVRTTLERIFPLHGTAIGVESLDPKTARDLAMFQAMIDVVIVASLIIAACSLAVNMIAGLDERRRPFSLLRLAGAPVALLHRVVALETLVPLVLVVLVSVVAGLASSAMYLHSQVGMAFAFPGLAYWGTVLGGLAGAVVLVTLTFPVLDRVTGPEVARNE